MIKINFYDDEEKVLELTNQVAIPIVHNFIKIQVDLYKEQIFKFSKIIWNTEVPDKNHSLVIDVICHYVGEIEDTRLENQIGEFKKVIKIGRFNRKNS